MGIFSRIKEWFRNKFGIKQDKEIITRGQVIEAPTQKTVVVQKPGKTSIPPSSVRPTRKAIKEVVKKEKPAKKIETKDAISEKVVLEKPISVTAEIKPETKGEVKDLKQE